jgi:hypothetical protein
MPEPIENLIQLLSDEAVLSSSQLQAKLAISQPSLSRLVSRAGSKILRIGRARAAMYALSRPVFGVDGAIPVYAIDENGLPQQLANLYGIGNEQFYIETYSPDRWLKGGGDNGIYPSLPYMLDDLRLEGFMGRLVAHNYAARLGYPDDAKYWSAQQVGHYLLQDGFDLSGHLVLGDSALHDFQRRTLDIIDDRESVYPDRANAILKQWQGGSSAGGEHQKFTAYTRENGHVIVKYSPAGDSVEARRWQDLLICEYHALNSMSQADMPAASAQLFQFDGRVFLESQRFDRVGETGRVPMISLLAIDAEFVGLAQSWSKVAQKMQQQKLISSEDERVCLWNELYGHWIGNTDMHLGNLSMTVTERGFKLLPAYDMLPMIYAPVRGEIVKRNFILPVRPMQQADLWQSSGEVALGFWEIVAADKRVSKEFRQIAEDNVIKVKTLI